MLPQISRRSDTQASQYNNAIAWCYVAITFAADTALETEVSQVEESNQGENVAICFLAVNFKALVVATICCYN